MTTFGYGQAKRAPARNHWHSAALFASLSAVSGHGRALQFTCRLSALLIAASRPALAAGPTILVDGAPGADLRQVRAVREMAQRYRSVADEPPRVAPGAALPEQVAVEQRAQSIELALERARRNESEALWDQCVREAVGAMSDAIEVIAATGELRLLRDLHVQAGVCMSLSEQLPGARLHFLAAALLDERPPPAGLHREEAERVQAEAREEVLARPSGDVRIVTDPPGAAVLIDGREIPGTTPLEAEVRLGDHFVTFRRFRYEPNTEQRFLQPLGLVNLSLEPARRSTVSRQMAQLDRGAVSEDELVLGKAVLARAEQVLRVSVGAGSSGPYRLSLIDAVSGKQLREATLARSSEEAAIRRSVCDVLGEECVVSAGVPWYVWPLGGAAVLGGIIATAVIIGNRRDARFCPPAGCR
jgi:hypothetical protein